jgi:hypothetical protein
VPGFAKIPGYTEVPIITPFGSIALRCQPGIWTNSGADMVVPVHCVGPSGVLVDSRFTILLTGDGALPSRFGFIYANAPSTTSYTPDPNFSFSSSGANPAVMRTGIGTYTADLGLARGASDLPEAYFVSAVDALTSTCTVPSWINTASIACFRQNGTPVDAAYALVLLERGRPGKRFAIALADQPSTAAYVANAQYSRSSSGLPIQITRQVAGHYVVTFFGLAKGINQTETIVVSAAGPGGAYCTIAEWINSSGSDLSATVRCFTTGGSVADARFVIALIE